LWPNFILLSNGMIKVAINAVNTNATVITVIVVTSVIICSLYLFETVIVLLFRVYVDDVIHLHEGIGDRHLVFYDVAFSMPLYTIRMKLTGDHALCHASQIRNTMCQRISPSVFFFNLTFPFFNAGDRRNLFNDPADDRRCDDASKLNGVFRTINCHVDKQFGIVRWSESDE